MTSQEMLNVVTAEPFQPFRIHTASGREFSIRHPEFLKVGRSSVTVYSQSGESSPGPPGWEEISLVLIESVAPLDQSSRKNGQ